MDTPKVFESEYRFCLILWKHEPVASQELVRLCAEQLGWKQSTTFTVMKRLGERGVLKNENSVVSSLVSKDEVQAAEVDQTLSVYWFNPVLWLSYVLLCRDIELACDEKVIQHMGSEARADYSQALLSCSVSHRTIAACPPAFGEVGVRARIKGVLHDKKPVFWIAAAAVAAGMVLAVCFLTDPADYQQEIYINGLIYTQSGDAVETLPIHSVEIGALKGVRGRTTEHPTEQLTGTNLEESFSGCSVYQLERRRA